jgi:hypothetical protein
MIPNAIKDMLMENWGTKADSMQALAQIKFIDEHSKWACYVYALNPEDEDTVACIIESPECFEICDWSLNEIYRLFNETGESPEIDEEYRPMKAINIVARLREYKDEA